MRASICSASLSALLSFIPVSPASGAERASALDALLSRPPSPGSITLLVAHVDDERVQRRLIDAVANPDASVRAAAARVLNVSAVSPAVPELRKAVLAETAPGAAVEQVRALLALDEINSDGLALETAERLYRQGHRTAGEAVLIAFARASGSRSWQYITRLVAMTTDVDVWRMLVDGATRGGRVGVEETTNALFATGNADVWQGLLIALGDSGVRVPDSAIVAALNAGPPRSGLTCWHLASGDTSTISDEVRAALGASASEAGTTNATCDVVRRLADASADRPPMLETLRSSPPPGLSSALRDRVVLPIRRASSPHAFSSIRLAAEYVAGAVADAAAVGGCRWPGSPPLIAGDLMFDRHGRPVKGSLGTAGLSDACAAVAKALLLTNLAPRRHAPVPDGRELVVLPFTKIGMECLSDEQWLTDPIQPMRVGGGQVVTPKKTRDMPPVYPAGARRDGVQGTVVMEATISRTGCVQKAEVVNGAAPLLDLAAVQAVSQWQFVPTTLDGAPVPVMMNVTVSFGLH